jgi:hypothetical protein
MWQLKKFKTLAAQNAWCEKNRDCCQIVILFVNNAYAVEYRRLRLPRLPR